MLPLYTNCNSVQVSKLHKITMQAARLIIGKFCFKKSTNFILKTSGIKPIRVLIRNSSLKLLHKTIFAKKPNALYTLLKINNRKTAPIHYKHTPKTKLLKNYYLYKIMYLYNSIPNKFKLVPHKRFKIYLKYDKINLEDI